MSALDLFGRRWTLRVLWELRDGPVGARALLTRCDNMSPSVLYVRLGELREARLIAQDRDGRYKLTDLGGSLGSAMEPLDRWAQAWARELDIAGEEHGTTSR